MPEPRPRVAVIGAGAWGLNHVRVLHADPEWELVAFVDPAPAARARAHAVAPRARPFEDLDALLASGLAEAVVLATPARTHAALACRVIAAGLHVLIEKPLALCLEDARSVARASAQANVVVMVGHLMVFHPAVIRLRELVRAGSLGAFHYLHAIRANLGRLRHDESALWSFGPHDLAMIDYLLDQRPIDVTARGQQVLQQGIEDVVFLTLRFDGGQIASLHLSWLHPRKERKLTLVCARKMVEFDDVAPEKLRIYDKGYERAPTFTEFAEYLTLRDGDVYIPQLSMEEPLRLELRHFRACITQGLRPITDLGSAIGVIATLEAAQRSLEQDGAPVRIESASADDVPSGMKRGSS